METNTNNQSEYDRTLKISQLNNTHMSDEPTSLNVLLIQNMDGNTNELTDLALHVRTHGQSMFDSFISIDISPEDVKELVKAIQDNLVTIIHVDGNSYFSNTECYVSLTESDVAKLELCCGIGNTFFRLSKKALLHALTTPLTIIKF